MRHPFTPDPGPVLPFAQPLTLSQGPGPALRTAHPCLFQVLSVRRMWTFPPPRPTTPIPFSTQRRSFLNRRQPLSKGVGHATSATVASQRFCKLICRVCTPPAPSLLSLVPSRCTDKNVVSTVDGECRRCAVRPMGMIRGYAFALNLLPKWDFFLAHIQTNTFYSIGLDKLAMLDRVQINKCVPGPRFRAVGYHLP